MNSLKKDNLNNLVKPFFDVKFFFIIITIILFGLLILSSASIEISSQKFNEPFYYLFRQIGNLIFSILICSCFIFISSESLKKNYKVFFYFFLFLLFLVIIPDLGKTSGGSTRWLSFFGRDIQPSEFYKLFYIVWLCAYLDNNSFRIKKLEVFIIPFIWLFISSILLMMQPDFGSTVIIFYMTLIMLFIAKARFIYLTLVSIVGFVAAYLIVMNFEYIRKRLDFFEPCKDAFGDGYQLCYSLMAIGSGSVFGKGLGASTSKLFFLPAAHTDFIFAILAEELGIFGIIFVILLFYLFLHKCITIGDKAIRIGLVFQGYLSYAVGIFISSQVLFNMAINLGIAPTKGLALPFFSYGGSNYLVSLLAITMVFRIYRDVYKNSLNSSIR